MRRKSNEEDDNNNNSDENNKMPHLPVMKQECIDNLNIMPGGVYVDCTMGFGGHTSAILEKGGKVIGFDQDPDAIAYTSSLLKDYIASGKLEIIESNFRYIKSALGSSKILLERQQLETTTASATSAVGLEVDGILMDLGISSYQIDQPTRGFSFSSDGPLDMRMRQPRSSVMEGVNAIGSGSDDVDDDEDEEVEDEDEDEDKEEEDDEDDASVAISTPTAGFSAATIVNEWDVTAIADVLYKYGEERKSRQIAREIVMNRPLRSTKELEWIIGKKASFKDRPKVLARYVILVVIFVGWIQ
jgi:16S rRNA C1402 N4-methylase RsmH